MRDDPAFLDRFRTQLPGCRAVGIAVGSDLSWETVSADDDVSRRLLDRDLGTVDFVLSVPGDDEAPPSAEQRLDEAYVIDTSRMLHLYLRLDQRRVLIALLRDAGELDASLATARDLLSQPD